MTNEKVVIRHATMRLTGRQVLRDGVTIGYVYPRSDGWFVYMPEAEIRHAADMPLPIVVPNMKRLRTALNSDLII